MIDLIFVTAKGHGSRYHVRQTTRELWLLRVEACKGQYQISIELHGRNMAAIVVVPPRPGVAKMNLCSTAVGYDTTDSLKVATITIVIYRRLNPDLVRIRVKI